MHFLVFARDNREVFKSVEQKKKKKKKTRRRKEEKKVSLKMEDKLD